MSIVHDIYLQLHFSGDRESVNCIEIIYAIMSHDLLTVGDLAPVVDEVREIAREEMPSPQTCRLNLWDGGEYEIYIFHSRGTNEREQVVYDNETGDILCQYRKMAPEWDGKTVQMDDGTKTVPDIIEYDE